MSKSFPKGSTRSALLSALPGNDISSVSDVRNPGFTYVPPSHARALDPENTIVEGIRGAGKSFWWQALNSAQHREFIRTAFPEVRFSEGLQVAQGFGAQANPLWPSKDVLRKLSSEFEPRHIWRAVIATHARFDGDFPINSKWEDKTRWIAEHPEEFDKELYRRDAELSNTGATLVILFDALDRLADDWNGIRPLAKSLFQVGLDTRSLRAIRLKMFVRPDMLEDKEIIGFPDASKLLARKVSLAWRRVDLYALLFQCLGNAPEGGDEFRIHCTHEFNLIWRQGALDGPWIIPSPLRTDEELQKAVFHAIAGPAMASGASGHKRGFPYTWLPNHLLDGREQVSPRSYAAALRHAALVEETPSEWPYALHYKAIQQGVQEASRVRVDEITKEDYPWVEVVMQPLRRQITVPCPKEEILNIWNTAGTIDSLNQQTQSKEVKLLPPHLQEGSRGVLEDLVQLGVIQYLSGDRLQMPDVYRIAFGLGRRGGVKPLR